MKQLYISCFLLCSLQTATAQCLGNQGEINWWQWSDFPLITWTMDDFDRFERFPNGPDYTRILNSTVNPTNFTDRFGSLTKGFIYPDSTGNAEFWVEADDEYQFYLSTDATAANLVEISRDTANPDIIPMTKGSYYYFELVHVDFGGGDDASVRWRADFLFGGITAPWRIISTDYLYGTCDVPCQPMGTSCDDSNASTQNDQWDGNCNCVGTPTTSNSCVGERGVLNAYLYNNLSGGAVSVLETAITNNTQPDKLEALSPNFGDFYNNDNNDFEEYGTYIQAYLTVPVSGYYDFNITGSDENIFYISSDDSPANKTNTILRNYWWTGPFGHDQFNDRTPSQTVTGLYLNADQYYYVELTHKGDGGYEFFNLFWKTPYQTRNEWLRIPTFHFFDYTCEAVCVKSEISCNDNDPYTANDLWDGNCNCVGTPCTAPDCDDPSTSYLQAEECETTNLIDNRADDAWLSCAPLSDAPNTARNGNHWIQYDFGDAYNLGTTQVWNYNVDGATASGFQQVVIDYSTDGIHWQELGTYNWNLASGTTDYEGFVGPDFSNITARYVLISSLDDPNSCRGIHKIAFNAVSCPKIEFSNPSINQSLVEATDVSQVAVTVTAGEAAINSVALYLDNTLIASDNTAPYEWNDLAALQNLSNGDYELSAIATDANGTECELSTQIHAVALTDFPCQAAALVLNTTEEMVYRTDATITSTSMVEADNPTFYVAEESITLMPGFHAVAGSEFTAMIAACSSTLTAPVAQSRRTTVSPIETHQITLFPNPVVDNFTLEINAYQSGKMAIRVYDVLGKEVRSLTRQQTVDKGVSTIVLPAESLTAGLYYCSIRIGGQAFTKPFVLVSGK